MSEYKLKVPLLDVLREQTQSSQGETARRNWYLFRILSLGAGKKVDRSYVVDGGLILVEPAKALNDLGFPAKPRVSSFTKYIQRILEQHPDGSSWFDGGIVDKTQASNQIQAIQDAVIKFAQTHADDTVYTFDIVDGDDLVQAYRTGPDSCMKRAARQLEIYRTNPDRVKLVKVNVRGVYTGRALIWKTDDGETVLDRIYPGNGVLAFRTRAWALRQGWAYKSEDGVGTQFIGLPEQDFRVTLKHPGNRRLPYLDSFRSILRLGIDSITLTTHRYNLNMMNAGYDDISWVYPAARFSDGRRAVQRIYDASEFFRDRADETWRKPLNVHTVELIAHRTPAGRHTYKAVLPGEIVYTHMGNRYTTAQVVQGTDGFYYFRSDVRKRGDTFIPKAGVNKYTREEYNSPTHFILSRVREVSNVSIPVPTAYTDNEFQQKLREVLTRNYGIGMVNEGLVRF